MERLQRQPPLLLGSVEMWDRVRPAGRLHWRHRHPVFLLSLEELLQDRTILTFWEKLGWQEHVYPGVTGTAGTRHVVAGDDCFHQVL